MDDATDQVYEVEVVLHAEYADRDEEAMAALTVAGLTGAAVIDDEGVVSGTVEAELLAGLSALPCVAYVRQVMSYTRAVRRAPGGDPLSAP